MIVETEGEIGDISMVDSIHHYSNRFTIYILPRYIYL